MIFGAIYILFRAGAVPGAPGARRGLQGAENLPKTRGRIYHFILPKVCPGWFAATWGGRPEQPIPKGPRLTGVFWGVGPEQLATLIETLLKPS